MPRLVTIAPIAARISIPDAPDREPPEMSSPLAALLPAQVRAEKEAEKQARLAKYDTYYRNTIAPAFQTSANFVQYDSGAIRASRSFPMFDLGHLFVEWLRERMSADNPAWAVTVQSGVGIEDANPNHVYVNLDCAPPTSPEGGDTCIM